MTAEEEVDSDVLRIFRKPWNLRQGRKVPDDVDVALDGGAVELDAAFLYADLADSSGLVTRFTPNVAGKVMRAYLSAMSRVASLNDGVVTNFDGDRIMAVFIGPNRAAQAARAALQMNAVLGHSLRKRARQEFPALEAAGYDLNHAVGIDLGAIRAIRAGRRTMNDLVWVGRAPAFAAKLSAHDADYMTYISREVHEVLPDDLKFNDDDARKAMWTPLTFEFVDQQYEIFASSWHVHF